jgi:hypothetical protein
MCPEERKDETSIPWPNTLTKVIVVLLLLSWIQVLVHPVATAVSAASVEQIVLRAVADASVFSGTPDMNWGDWGSLEVGYDDHFGIERSLV